MPPLNHSTNRMRITLDTNAVIDLEESGPAAVDLRELIRLHADGRITVCVSKIAASERDRNSNGHPDYNRFLKKLQAIGLGNAELLTPLGYFDVTFWDNCLSAGPDDEALANKIWDILFPGWRGQPNLPPDKGRNALCDVANMWCHIKHRGDVFVTRDQNFHKATKKPDLIALGARNILEPSQTLHLIRQAQSP